MSSKFEEFRGYTNEDLLKKVKTDKVLCRMIGEMSGMALQQILPDRMAKLLLKSGAKSEHAEALLKVLAGLGCWDRECWGALIDALESLRDTRNDTVPIALNHKPATTSLPVVDNKSSLNEIPSNVAVVNQEEVAAVREEKAKQNSDVAPRVVRWVVFGDKEEEEAAERIVQIRRASAAIRVNGDGGPLSTKPIVEKKRKSSTFFDTQTNPKRSAENSSATER